MAQFMVSLFLMIALLIAPSKAIYDITNYGAKPDGHTDAAKPLLSAWADACGANGPTTLTIPEGNFFVSQATMKGPCASSHIEVDIKGTLTASSGYGPYAAWILFENVDGLTINGGTLEGQGSSLWDCKKKSSSKCPKGAKSLRIEQSKNVLVDGITIKNSKYAQMIICHSTWVTVQHVTILAPSFSPNTDGIQIRTSNFVTILDSTIGTGDDCIAMGQGAQDVWIERIHCGPGHGISIGSLGKIPNELGVKNITVRNVTLSDTTNGLRIKTWSRPNPGFVRDISYFNALMNNVMYPIIITQNYEDHKKRASDKIGSSLIQISNVTYTNIHGTSATEVAMKFNCSSSKPCNEIVLQDVDLVYGSKPAQSTCSFVHGHSYGAVVPTSCF